MARNSSTRRASGTNKRPAPARDPSKAPESDRRWVVALVLAAVVAVGLVVALLLVLGGDEASDHSGGPAAGGADPGVAHVHGLGVDPKDGTLYAATHYGVFRIPQTGQATRIADRYQDTMGFTVVGPQHFLGSGHPDLREDKPSRLGLIESTDGGLTWRSLSLEGEADFHALKAAHGRVYGFDSTSSQFMVSTDRRTWERRSLTPMLDFAVSPENPDTILATLEYGLARSDDGGRSFGQVRSAPPVTLLAWPAPHLLYGATASGAVLASSDGGTTWEQRGSLNGRPEALVATGAQTVHAATESGIYTSTDGGRTFQLRYG